MDQQQSLFHEGITQRQETLLNDWMNSKEDEIPKTKCQDQLKRRKEITGMSDEALAAATTF